MKKSKKIKQLIKKVVQDVFASGKLDEKKAQRYLKAFRKLPTHEALVVLKEFEKQLKRRLAGTTLTIESAIKLTPDEVKKVERVMKQHHVVNSLLNIYNPSLLGGLKIKIGDQVYDDSISTKIKEVGEAIKI